MNKKYVSQIKTEEILQMKNTMQAAHSKLVAEYIDKMKKAENRPEKMQYFDGIADFFGNRAKELIELKKSGRKIIGYTCMFAPLELILASGAIPVRIDSGFYDSAKIGDRLLPVEVCPVIRSTIGAKMIGLNPYLELCDTIISSNTCDGKTKLGELLSDYLPVWMVTLPCVKDSKHAKEYWLQETREMKKKLEKLTGNAITVKKLKKAISLSLNATTAVRRLQDIRKNRSVISGRDAMLATQMFFYDDIERWTKNINELCDELDAKAASGKFIAPENTPRILITGSPMIWPDNWKIPNLIEDATPAGIIAADELCSGDRFMYDPVGVDELSKNDLFDAVAERYLLPCSCPCFTTSEDGNRDRVDKLLTLIKDFKINGVIYHVIRGCHLYAIEYMRIRRILEREKIPVYYLDTEYSREDVGQMKTRVEAFMEMLKSGADTDDLY